MVFQPAALSQIAPFASLSPSAALGPRRRAVERRFAIDERRCREGDPRTGIFPILEGRVKIFNGGPAERGPTRAVKRAPPTAAGLPLFEGGPYRAPVRMLGTGTARFIRKADWQQVCRRIADAASLRREGPVRIGDRRAQDADRTVLTREGPTAAGLR